MYIHAVAGVFVVLVTGCKGHQCSKDVGSPRQKHVQQATVFVQLFSQQNMFKRVDPGEISGFMVSY